MYKKENKYTRSSYINDHLISFTFIKTTRFYTYSFLLIRVLTQTKLTPFENNPLVVCIRKNIC
ncbi:hypothetical protein Hanom_Chr09g00846431 [Helianthus anomalus]